MLKPRCGSRFTLRSFVIDLCLLCLADDGQNKTKENKTEVILQCGSSLDWQKVITPSHQFFCSFLRSVAHYLHRRRSHMIVSCSGLRPRGRSFVSLHVVTWLAQQVGSSRAEPSLYTILLSTTKVYRKPIAAIPIVVLDFHFLMSYSCCVDGDGLMKIIFAGASSVLRPIRFS